MIDLSLSRPRAAATTILGIVGFAAALSAASQVAIPIPGTPVPITLQPLLVVLAGFWLGPVAGAASMVLYLTLGAAGLPVFAPVGVPGIGRLLGPTGGYLLAYPVAAFVSGALLMRVASLPGRWLAAAAGILVLYIGGLSQLALLTGSLERAVVLGVLPFVAWDVLKALIAALAAPKPSPRALD